MIDLTLPAKNISERYNLPVQEVIALCPQRLALASSSTFVQYRREELEALVDEWADAVVAVAKNRRRVSEESDLKRLKYFRRKYGPHITMEHLPRGKK